MQFLPITLTAALFVLSLWRPPMALTALLVMFPLGIALQATLPIFAAHSWLFNVVIAGIAGIAILRMAMSPMQSVVRYLFTPTFFASCGLYSWACLTLAWTPDSEAPLRELVNGLPYWILLLIAAPMLIQRVEDLDWLLPSLLYCGTLIAVMIILNPNFDYYAGRFGLDLGGRERTNPLQLGTLGGMLVIVASLTFLRRGTVWSVAANGAALVAGAGIALLSGSRGNLIFAVLVCLAFFPVAYRLHSLRGLVLSAVAGIVALAGLYGATRWFITSENMDRWDPTDLAASGDGRLRNVVDLLSEYASRPEMWLQGLGLSAFRSINTGSGDPYSHVMLADALGETGLIGAVLLAIVAIAAWRSGRRLLSMLHDDSSSRCNAVVVLALAAYYFALANKQGSFLGSSTLFTFLIIAARVEQELRTRNWAPVDEQDREPLEATGLAAASR